MRNEQNWPTAVMIVKLQTPVCYTTSKSCELEYNFHYRTPVFFQIIFLSYYLDKTFNTRSKLPCFHSKRHGSILAVSGAWVFQNFCTVLFYTCWWSGGRQWKAFLWTKFGLKGAFWLTGNLSKISYGLHFFVVPSQYCMLLCTFWHIFQGFW